MVKIYGTITTVMYTKHKSEDEKTKGYLALSTHGVAAFPWKIAASVLLSTLVFAQIVYEVKFSEQSQMVTLVPSMLFFLSLVTHIPQLIEHYHKRNELCAGFNGFLDFERRHNGTLFWRLQIFQTLKIIIHL